MTAVPVMDLERVEDEDRELVDRIIAAFESLPADRRRRVWRRFAEHVAAARRTDDMELVRRALTNLLATARMYQNPEFVQAQDRAAALPDPKPGTGLDVEEYIAEARERYPYGDQ